MIVALVLVATSIADPGHRPDPSAELWRRPPEAPPPVGTWFAAAQPGLRPCAQPAPPCGGDPLPLGADLVVVETHDAAADGARVRWHRVAPATVTADLATAAGPPVGWVPDRGLTQAAFTADLSGDGAAEVVAV
jgi:hypothetical protein